MSDAKVQNRPNEGEGQLPSSVTVFKFTAARGKEIEIMKKALSSKSGTKLVFQKLPKHMRRRAMSHNVKRLPRRLREIHLNQMKKSGLPPKQKRPSRKYRRRPYNLMSDYMRRQRRIKWLNTHIWHAKRFRMIEKWGYKLPDRPCDRAFRACYRATVSHCLVQDVSYYGCVEISGNYDVIIDNFKKITDPKAGLTIAAKCFAEGRREGAITLFKFEGRKAIGNVYFHWRPTHLENKHVLWVWIHAAYYSEILDTFVKCFDLELISMEIDSRTISLYKSPDDKVELRELQFELNRFRLTGPLSTSVLYNCFQIPEREHTSEWLKMYESSGTQLNSQNEYWENIKGVSSPAELSPHMILPLTVLDPRFFLPKKRTKAVPETRAASTFSPTTVSELSGESPLWDSNIREAVRNSKISNAQLADLHKTLLVPGSSGFKEKAVPIPVLLIQRPGKKTQQNVGYGSGWDLVIPSEWAQPVWISLIMWGARPGGLRESKCISFQMDQETLYPDTESGMAEEKQESEKCRDTFFKLPPNKRTNYNRFRIASPFRCDWSLLLNEWAETDEINDFFVLRDKRILKDIQECLVSKSKPKLPNCQSNCLIPVSIKLSDKGLCQQFAIICLPQESDLKKCPTEPNCPDENETLRKEMRKNHKTLLKKLRRRRIRGKRSGKVIPIDQDILKNYTTSMRKLWLPDAKTIRHSCVRQVIGFVKHGDFSLSLGQSKAVGYIAYSSLVPLLLLKSPNKVLLRNTNSKQYRLGTMDVICD